MHDRRAQRRAALAGRAEAAEQRALDREVDVGVVHHDHRVLAAELQARRLRVAARQLADLGADGARAREADLVDEALLERLLEARERRRAVGLDEVEHAAGDAAGVEDLDHRVAERRRVLGRLPDDRVAAQDRRHQVPGRHGDREVARGDDRGHADRRAEREQLLVGHLRRDRLAVQPPALADEEVAGVDDLLHLAARLGDRLADLARDELGERLLVGLEEASDLGDHAPAGGSGDLRPLLLGGARGGARVDERGGVGERDLGDDVVELAGVGGGEVAAGRVGTGLAADHRSDRGGARRRLGARAFKRGHGVHTTATPAKPSACRSGRCRPGRCRRGPRGRARRGRRAARARPAARAGCRREP